MRRFTLLLIAAAMLAALLPAGARAQLPSPDSAIPAPEPVVVKLNHTPTVELFDGGAGLPYLGATAPYNAGDAAGMAAALTAFHDLGTYDRELAQIGTLADEWVVGQGRHGHGRAARARAAKATRGHKHGRGAEDRNHGKLAVVLDIDETSLSNYSAILADGFKFGPASQAEATNEVGVAIQPTLKVFNDAKARGIAVFFITGRPEAQRAVTAENLEREGFHNWDGLSLKPAGTTLTTVSYKSGARASIEQQGFHIIANVGDQYSDLAGGHADRAFKMPNPFYFLP
jgi:putative acid phosphatase of HAD superfamily subfamily IIIB